MNILKEKRYVKLLLLVILGAAFFVRVYRLDQLLGFYFDQGRDALVIWRFWHEGDLFLAGPTTGIEGILRGPWYYWLIAPFYLLGGGDPIWPAVFLAFTSVVALWLLYKLAKEIAGEWAGLLAALLGGFSYYLILASRWLSNPTPMLLISMLLLWAMFKILEKKQWAWVLVAFLLGMAMQFGSAAEAFYFLAVVIFSIWQRDKLPDRKVFLLSVFALFITFVPQLIFDIIHKGVLSTAVRRFLFEQESFKVSFWEIFPSRVAFYYQVFFQKLFPITRRYWDIFLAVFLFAGLLHKNLLKDKRFLTIIIVAISPLVGMFFFQGNEGKIFDYYFSGYYLVFVLTLSVVLARFSKSFPGFVLVSVFLILFASDNLLVTRNYLSAGVDGPTTIALGNQLQVVDWVYQDAQGNSFNVDIYVPPIIPYSYDYIFTWYGKAKYGSLPTQEQVKLLYTLVEADEPHKTLRDQWLFRQSIISSVEKKTQFGGIEVQRRVRFNTP